MPFDINFDIVDDRLLGNVLASLESKPQSSALELASLLYQLATVVRNTRMGVRCSDTPDDKEIDRGFDRTKDVTDLVEEQARLIKELTSKLDHVLSTVCTAMGQSVHVGVSVGLDRSVAALVSLYQTARDQLAGLQREYKDAAALRTKLGSEVDVRVVLRNQLATVLRVGEGWKIDAGRAIGIAERAITLAAGVDASDAFVQELLNLVGELRAVDNDAAERACAVVCRENDKRSES